MPSISPTFYEHICSNILAQKIKPNMYAQKIFAQNLRAKATRKILVKLTQGSMLALIVTKKRSSYNGQKIR
jgi:hypothetical protein